MKLIAIKKEHCPKCKVDCVQEYYVEAQDGTKQLLKVCHHCKEKTVIPDSFVIASLRSINS